MASFVLPKFNMEEKLLEKTFILKEISLKRIVIILCSQPDVILLCENDCFENEIEDGIKDKLSKLPLPLAITQQMKCLIEPISSEIRNWKLCHDEYFKISKGSLYADILEHLCWTLFGTIDYRKTAENLIYLEKLDIVERYRLACLHCLEDAIPVLWGRLPEDNKRYFYDEVALHIQCPQLEFCWPYIIKGEEIKLDSILERLNENPSFNLHAFHYSATEGNKSATKHFLKRLRHVERENSLLRAAQDILIERASEDSRSTDKFPDEKLSENFLHLLSLLTSEQQMEIFNMDMLRVLACLLDWPWRCIFLDIATLFWPFVTKEDYYTVLEEISTGMFIGYNFQKLFQDFFLLGSNDFKKYFVCQEYQYLSCLNADFLSNLSEIDIAEFIEIIFRNIDPADRKRLVSSRIIFRNFFSILSRDKFHIVEPYLREATLSKEDKEEVMGAFLRYLDSREVKKINLTGSSWERFFQFFNESKEEVPGTIANKENRSWPLVANVESRKSGGILFFWRFFSCTRKTKK